MNGDREQKAIQDTQFMLKDRGAASVQEDLQGENRSKSAACPKRLRASIPMRSLAVPGSAQG